MHEKIKIFLVWSLACLAVGATVFDNVFAENVTITKKYKSDTSGADYKYGSNRDHWTSKLQVTYSNGTSYVAMCIDPKYETPAGTTKTVTTISDSTKNAQVKKTLLVSPIGNSSAHTAFLKYAKDNGFDWTSLATSESGLTTKVNDKFALFHVVAGYKYAGVCNGWGNDVCKARYEEIKNFFSNNSTYNDMLNNYEVKIVARSNNQQAIAWLEPVSTPTPPPTPQPVISSASFSGSVSVSSNDTGLIASGGKYWTYAESGSATFTASGTITRSSYDSYGGASASKYSFSSNTRGLSTSALSKGGSSYPSTTFTGSWSSLSKGSCTNVSMNLYYDNAVSYSDSTETSRTNTYATGTTQVCRYNDDIAKFTGSTTLGDLDTNLVCTGTTNNKSCTGLASVGTYTFSMTNSVFRTSDASTVTSAKVNYKLKANHDSGNYTDITGTESANLTVSTTKRDGNILGKKTRSLNIPESDTANQTKSYCERVDFSNSATYYNGSLVSEPTINDYSSSGCISIIRPKNYYNSAEFSGNISIIDNQGTVVSCTGGRATKFGSSTSNETIECLGPTYLDTFDLTFNFNLVRSASDSYSGNHSSKFNTNVVKSTYSSTTLSNLKSTLFTAASSKQSSDLSKTAPNNSETVRQTNPGGFTVTVSKDDLPVTYCAYFAYASKYTYKNGNYTSTKGPEGSSGLDTDGVYKCIKIVNPDKIWNVNFSAGSDKSLTDSAYFLSGSSTSGYYYQYFSSNRDADYYLATRKTGADADKYLVNFSHYVKRNDVINYVDSSGNCVSEECKAVRTAVLNNFNLKDKNSVDITGKSWSERFSISLSGTTGIGQRSDKTNGETVYLPTATKKKVCEKVAYDKVVPYRYSTKTEDGDTTRGETTLACLILANPRYEYKWEETSRKTVAISASSEVESVTGATSTDAAKTNWSVTAYEGMKVSLKHTVSRGNDEFTAGSDKVTPYYLRTLKAINVASYNNAGSSEKDSSYQIGSALAPNGSFLVNAKVSPYTVPNGSLKAGETKSICSKIVVSPSSYYVRFGNQYIREAYDTVDAGLNGTSSWVGYKGNGTSNRVNLRIPTSEGLAYYNWATATFRAPVQNSGTTTESSICANLTREYNFNVTTIKTTTPPLQENPNPGDNFSPTFTITVEKADNKNYITDLEDPEIRIITFRVDSDVENRSSVANIDGKSDSLGSSPNFCNILSGYKSGTCEVKSSKTSGSGININELKDPETNTTHHSNSYYSSDSYSESYTYKTTVPADLEVGEKFCIAFAIGPKSSSSSEWALSASSCATVSKRPTLQVHGGSILAIGKKDKDMIITSRPKADGKIFGSWGDFSIISAGRIVGMGSGASLSGGNSSSDFCNSHSPLSLANINCLSSGSEKAVGELNLISNRSKTLNTLFERFAPLAGDNENIIAVDGNYRIRTSNSFTDSYSPNSNLESISEIPQRLILVKGNVDIDPGVTEINAWIIATGRINTCTGYSPTNLSSNVCTEKLVINGPVFASGIDFNRTYGGEKDSIEEPAELIDYNPATFLWGYHRATGVGVPQLTYIKELSPRY